MVLENGINTVLSAFNSRKLFEINRFIALNASITLDELRIHILIIKGHKKLGLISIQIALNIKAFKDGWETSNDTVEKQGTQHTTLRHTYVALFLC